MIIFHSHSLSSTLTRSIVPLKLSMGNSITGKEVYNTWSWPKVNGKLSCWCLSSCAYSCGVALSSKEVTWVLRSTKNYLGSRKSQGSGLLPGVISWVKLGSILTIYGNIWRPIYRQRGNVSESLRQSLLIYSGHLSELQGGIRQSDPRITTVARYRGALSLLLPYLLSVQIRL